MDNSLSLVTTKLWPINLKNKIITTSLTMNQMKKIRKKRIQIPKTRNLMMSNRRSFFQVVERVELFGLFYLLE
ncbi:hypothetical protein AZF04_06885 [Alkalihalobacillus trypoxylicola]|uniref:Uncharacterized protein n=1 Tax=Alkalihalobacillus trypoxylicola TaxID=519424 RepID=A0A162DD47_9BACI|nr:hypothetical protein AZF04_06885 [Alkalihalobacillus trypoxylicola]